MGGRVAAGAYAKSKGFLIIEARQKPRNLAFCLLHFSSHFPTTGLVAVYKYGPCANSSWHGH